ncbi:MAG: phenylalanine--tRNA ligase subunit beta [Planctomycetes bacterium]|nr:phenylalanine--tRNA ligase subunit beta [Planctomycetota bacterium]
MKFTTDWLADYCRTGLPTETIAELLTKAGVKVEGVEERGGETVIELEITANRPDCLSLIGVAREVSVVTGKPMQEPGFKLETTRSFRSPDWMLDVQAPELCPRYVGRIVKGLKVGPSPAAMRKRLEAIGLRSINNVVDITNYVLYECGQPLHAFDLNKLSGKSILVRKGNPGEKLRAIDGKEYDVAGALVIADAEKAVAIAGVMGGKDTEVTEATTDILLESAAFDPVTVRRTSLKLGLASDSSYRFQRGVDPARVDWASRRAVFLMREHAGARPDTMHLDTNPESEPKRQLQFPVKSIGKILGRDVEDVQARKILEGLGFEIREEVDGVWRIAIPTWRADVTRDVDLVEEVARVYGYDRIPASPRVNIALARPHPADEAARAAKDALRASGHDEVLTLSFTGKFAAEAPFIAGEAVGVLGKTGKREEQMRTGLVPSLLEAVRMHESYGEKGADLFEIAKVYARDARGFQERTVLGIASSRGFLALKGSLENVLERLGVLTHTAFRPGERAHLAPGRTAVISHGAREIGSLGEISAALAASHDLRSRPCVAEIDFDVLVEAAKLKRHFADFPTLPSVQRDIAVVLDRAVAWADIESAVRASAQDDGLLESITFFDLYEGKGIPAGKKSVAFSLTLRASDRTLTSAEADAVVQAAVAALGASFQATLRQ